MKSGKIVKKLELEGKELIFRYPRFEDVDELLKFINNLVAEKAMLATQKKQTKKQEVEWLANELKKVELKEKISLVAERRGEIVGKGEIRKSDKDAQRHVGELGIALLKEVRGKGIAKILMELMIEEAKRELGVDLVVLWVFGRNKRAQGLYRKCGFKEKGRVAKGLNHYGKLDDQIWMARHI